MLMPSAGVTQDNMIITSLSIINNNSELSVPVTTLFHWSKGHWLYFCYEIIQTVQEEGIGLFLSIPPSLLLSPKNTFFFLFKSIPIMTMMFELLVTERKNIYQTLQFLSPSYFKISLVDKIYIVKIDFKLK